MKKRKTGRTLVAGRTRKKPTNGFTGERLCQAQEVMRAVRAKYKAKADEAIRRRYADPEFKAYFMWTIQLRNADPAYWRKWRRATKKAAGEPRYRGRMRTYTSVPCLRCGEPFPSWHKTKNRRCLSCRSLVSNRYVTRWPTTP